jgi:uncharacterized ferritin-like protein (DUF455 family)
VGDRLRAAAFAEIQAREAFVWGARVFTEAPEGLRLAWREFAAIEDRHLGWLLRRMQELGISVEERSVSDQLWRSLISCQNARDFAFFMASAEERGRRAGERFREALAKRDPITAEIFGKIAEEEVEHIAAAFRFYPEGPATAHLATDLQDGPTVEQGSTRGPEV